MAFDLFANFERASNNSIFYRVTTAPSTYSVTYKIDNLTNTFELSNYSATYSLNGGTFVNLPNLQTTININVASIPQTTTFRTRLSARVDGLGLSAGQIKEFEISAKFVSSLLSATKPFILYPSTYFVNYERQQDLAPSNVFQDSPGLSFYGEGHTQVVYLCTQAVNDVDKYVWKFGDFTEIYTPKLSSSFANLITAAVAITSDIGFYPTIPVQLQLTNTTFPSTGPIYFYNDITGRKEIYPYVISTQTADGEEDGFNTRFRESIQVLPYGGADFLFIPGSQNIEYLPYTGQKKDYLASLRINLALGRKSLDPCFEKYGIVWRWSTFSLCSAETDDFIGDPNSWFTVCSSLSTFNVNETFVDFPSSWSSLQCLASAGTTPSAADISFFTKYTKKWGFEPALSADRFNVNPVFCSGGPVTWNLSSVYWQRPTLQITQFVLNSALETVEYFEYPYELQLSGYGTELDTASYYFDTPLLLTIQRPLTCLINAEPFDWKPKTSLLSAAHFFKSVPPPEFKLYTPNKFVLTGTEVKFENLTPRLNLLNSIEVDYGDGSKFTTTNVFQNFTHTYSAIGPKTVTLKGNTIYDNIPVIFSFPNLVNVVSQYDDIQPQNYQSLQNPLELPHPNKIQIAPNDLGVEDVFNSSIDKFYNNLDYLNRRGFIYSGTFSEYFGWLGPQPIIIEGVLSGCPLYTWEDVNCDLTPETSVTWIDASATDTFTGSFSRCGTWLQQTCGTRKISPDCFGLYNVNWQWKERKNANTQIPIYWKETRQTGVYPKRWYFEPSPEIQLFVCDDGIWNVNIPRIDTYYDPIGNCDVQRRCRYTGVVSRNNILYTAQRTQIKVLSSDYISSFLSYENLFDDVTTFRNIKNIALDSEGKVFVLDNVLTQVGVYTITNNIWELFIAWGGIGSAQSRNRFLRPNDIHVDQFDSIWVTDTGNNCLKQYTNSGTWLQTVNIRTINNIPQTPISMCVDSQTNLHVLTDNQIDVYTNNGNYLYSYDYKQYVDRKAVRINSSFNREVIYLCTDTQVIKFFRNGILSGYIIREKDCVNNITSLYQDEYRNLLITANDKILKYPDLMTLVPLKGNLPNYYWKLKDLYIHSEEYVQNWVYNKSLQRLWDNIEMLRATIFYTVEENRCNEYQPPVYTKEDILVGQNEIVTTAVINRSFAYLWENFMQLVKIFNSRCLRQN
jgi:hypothetical protein